MKKYILIELIFLPFLFIAAIVTKCYLKFGPKRFSISRKLLVDVFYVYPISNHYYEPLIRSKDYDVNQSKNRFLPGIDLNTRAQLELLSKFNFSSELLDIYHQKNDKTSYRFDNPNFASGDSEYLYNIIRHYKPKNIIEIGSGHSTLMAIEALEKNKLDDKNYHCSHTCIEPFEMPWLEKTRVTLVREIVQKVDVSLFKQLTKNDILFIDSSHMIKPQGDILKEYLEILPSLNSGVLIHVHDIFTPNDYKHEWLFEEMRFWNEQYLLEAFLCNNNAFSIIGAVNYLKNNHYEIISEKCPILAQEPNREPGSFWMIKN